MNRKQAPLEEKSKTPGQTQGVSEYLDRQRHLVVDKQGPLQGKRLPCTKQKCSHKTLCSDVKAAGAVFNCKCEKCMNVDETKQVH